MQKLQPVTNHVLIQPDEGAKQTTTGLYIPDSAKEKPQVGIILAAGPTILDEIAIGDKVLYKKYAGTQIEWNGQNLLILPDAEILAKIVEVDEI